MPRNYIYPSDDELVDLFSQHEYAAAVCREIGIPQYALLGHLKRRPLLQRRVDAVKKPYMGKTFDGKRMPADEELLRLVEEQGSVSAASRHLGIHKATLNVHVNRSPALKAAIELIMAEGFYSKERQRSRFKEMQQRWVAANPERVRLHYARRRHRQGPADADTVAFAELLRGDPCSYCGTQMEHVDHVEPLSSGGEHNWTNLTAACSDCNTHKHTKTLLQFLLSR